MQKQLRVWFAVLLAVCLVLAGCSNEVEPTNTVQKDMMLGVDEATPSTNEVDAETISAQGLPTKISDADALNGVAYKFLRTGDELNWKNLKAGTYNIYAWARSELYGDEAPAMTITVGSQALTKSFDSTSYQKVFFGQITIKEGNKLSTKFINDAWGGSADKDRNLILSHIWCEPTTNPAPTEPEPGEPEPSEPSEPSNPVPPTNNPNDFANYEPVLNGKAYYVSGSGNDSNNGLSQSTAFKTLQKAASLTNPGDTVLVMNGTYSKEDSNSNVLDINRAGRADAWIAYKAMPGHNPRIFVNNNYAGIRTIVPYIIIEGFTVEGNVNNLSFNEADKLARGTDSNAALNTTKFNSGGIMSYPEGSSKPHHLIIRNNTVFNHPGSGIASNGSDYVRIEDNIVYNNSYYSAYATSGVSFYQSRDIDSSTGQKMFIRRNTIYKNENKVPFWYSNASDPSKRSMTDGNGIIIDDAINEQTFISGGGSPYKGTFLIENNLVYDNGGRGINVYSSQNVVARNNTLYRNGRTPNLDSEIVIGKSSNVHFSSNIFSVDPSNKPISHYESSNVHFKNNLFHSGSDVPAYPEGSNADMASQDPSFISPSTNPSSANFRLNMGSPAIDKQSTEAPQHDITKAVRSGSSDLGAYETF
ncbi:MAG: right-handed parallel beta-helix repeat-containing protein [Trueperaceae bacterium]